jgi:hypothetical protein
MNKLTGVPPVIPSSAPNCPERRLAEFARELHARGVTADQAEANGEAYDEAAKPALVALLRLIELSEQPVTIGEDVAHVLSYHGGGFAIEHLPEMVTIAAEAYEVNLTSRGCDCRNAGELADELIAVIPAGQRAEVLEHLIVSETVDHITAGSAELPHDDDAREIARQMAAPLMAALAAQGRADRALRMYLTGTIRDELDFMLEQRAEPLEYGEPVKDNDEPETGQ